MVLCVLRLRVVPLSLCPFALTRTKTARKNWAPEILGMSIVSIALRIPIAHKLTRAHALKNGGFFFRVRPLHRGNSSFPSNEYGDISFCFCCFELSNKYLWIK